MRAGGLAINSRLAGAQSVASWSSVLFAWTVVACKLKDF